MKHNIRINGQIQTLECELGSGIFDKNGREIFEGDKIKFNIYRSGKLIEVEATCYEYVPEKGQLVEAESQPGGKN